MKYCLFVYFFCCFRGSKSVNKCSWCFQFFVDNDEIARYLDKRFKFPVDEFQYTGVEDIIYEVNTTRFRLSLYYTVSDFGTPGDNRNENLDLIFFGSANKTVQFYSLYLEAF